MTPVASWNRRTFLGRSLAVGAACLLPWRRSASWAVAGPPSPLRLAFFTDIHARVEWDTPEAMAQCADRINEQEADLVLCGGDMITDGYTSTPDAVEPRWRAYQQSLVERIRSPVSPALGNHDLVGVAPEGGAPPEVDPRSSFRSKTGLARTYRSMEADGCHLIFLDPFEITGGEMRYRGVIDPLQLDWLRRDLQAVDEATPIVVVTHMPLLSGFFQATGGATQPAPANRVVVNNLEVLRAFENHNLVLVLQGHLHVNEMLRWGTTTFITGGAVCGQWWRGPWHGTPEGFGVLTLREKQVDWQYRDYGWKARRPPGV